jgi:osmotically-inducible protein OsmY
MKTPLFTQMKRAVALVVACLFFSGAMYAQQKTSIAVKDLDSDIEKYIEKNFKDYKTTEAYKYAAIYEMKIKKEATVEVLVFDKEGKLIDTGKFQVSR